MQTASLSDIRKQVAVLAIAERFFDAAVLFALHDLGTLVALADGPRSLEELAGAAPGDEETLRAVVDAAVAMGMLSKQDDGRYVASAELVECLGRPGAPAYVGEWIEFLHALSPPVLDLAERVRTGKPQGALFEGMEADERAAQKMTRAMDAYARSRGIELADALDLSAARHLLDLGCGPGTYSMAIAERHPHLQITLLDLPLPIDEARQIARERGLEDRFRFVAADGLTYDDGTRYDVVLVSNVLHMLGPEVSRLLLKHCYDILAPGGRLVIQAQFLDDDRTSPRWPVLLNLIQRAATPTGRNHSISETRAWMEETGFRHVSHLRLSLWNVCSCLIGERPATPSSTSPHPA